MAGSDNVIGWFKTIILAQLFYAVAITLIAYAIPASAAPYVTGFSNVADEISLDSTSQQIQEGLESQTNIPVIELGALVFYSGNILVDLLLNFAFAIPQMLMQLLNAVMLLFGGLDTFMLTVVQSFTSVVVLAFYFIGLMQLLIGIRSGRTIA